MSTLNLLYIPYVLLPLFSFSRHQQDNCTADKISSLSQLEEGWRFGEGKKIRPGVLQIALKLNTHALKNGITQTDVFPGRKGDLTFAVYRADTDYAFKIAEDCSITCYSESQRFDESIPLTLTQAEAFIRRLGDLQQWNSSCYSILPISTQTSEGSEARPLKIPAAEVYPFLAGSAPWRNQEIYASTPIHTIPVLQLTQPYTG